MIKRLVAIGFIYAATCVAWLILGVTIQSRTQGVGDDLRSEILALWGTPQQQTPPLVTKFYPTLSGPPSNIQVPPESSKINVWLDLDHRQKGLLWYSTYTVRFTGEYSFVNNSDTDWLTLAWKYPSEKTIYDDLALTVNGSPFQATDPQASGGTALYVPRGTTAVMKVAYKSQGLDTWTYAFGNSVADVRNFFLLVQTNFDAVDFARGTLAPTSKKRMNAGWLLEWKYRNLVSGYPVGIVMPEHAQPGPLAQRISFFAPVSLFFFFFVLVVLTAIRGIHLHPMNYFFLAAAFFAFHLLLAYLVDHLPVHISFLISSLVSVGLVVSYLRLVVGHVFAIREAALAQILYLVLFSYAFFFRGIAGLVVTCGAILTLFVMMQVTARVRWEEHFAAKLPAANEAPSTSRS